MKPLGITDEWKNFWAKLKVSSFIYNKIKIDCYRLCPNLDAVQAEKHSDSFLTFLFLKYKFFCTPDRIKKISEILAWRFVSFIFC